MKDGQECPSSQSLPVPCIQRHKGLLGPILAPLLIMHSSFRIHHSALLIVSVALILTSCDYINKLRNHFVGASDAVVSIGEHHLYPRDLEGLVPENASTADSLAIIDDYIRTWATDILLYRNAQRNVVNEEEIRRLVDDYERTITIHYYRQNIVKEKIDVPSDDEAADYWLSHQQDFVLTQPAVKGIVVSLPKGTDNIAQLRRKMKNPEKNIADIERFALRHAIVYSLFDEELQFLSDIEKSTNRRLPVEEVGYFETTDSTSVNMVFITEFVPAGSTVPLSLAIDDARLRLYKERKMDYLKNMDSQIYQYALSHGEINFNPAYQKPDTVAVTDTVALAVADTVAAEPAVPSPAADSSTVRYSRYPRDFRDSRKSRKLPKCSL